MGNGEDSDSPEGTQEKSPAGPSRTPSPLQDSPLEPPGLGFPPLSILVPRVWGHGSALKGREKSKSSSKILIKIQVTRILRQALFCSHFSFRRW